MKKKREAKRQAKQQQGDEDLNGDKQNNLEKTNEPIQDEKLLKIKKINSVCLFLYCVNNVSFIFIIECIALQDLKSINRLKTLQSSGKELDTNQLARLKLENGLLAELKKLQL